MSDERKKPSGAEFRKARRARLEAERARLAAAGLPERPHVEPCPPGGEYGWLLARILEEVQALCNDATVPPSERRRHLAELTRAAATLQPKAAIEARLLELEEGEGIGDGPDRR